MKTAARVIFVLLLLRWTAIFLWWPMRQDTVGASFLHTISLPFHEAGHIFFSPFGDLAGALGGSLGQVLVPVICVIAFLTTSFDPFGAAVCAWWAGENLLDVAVYMNDARSLNLVLLGGHTGAEVDGHDWEHILGSLGALHLDHRLAWTTHWSGAVLMGGSLAAAVAVIFWKAPVKGPNE